jgi:hypothetical protein
MIRALARMARRLRYGPPIVVVTGLPRSGTSLMMQMLHAGGMDVVTDGVRAPDENNPRGYFELEAVKDLDKRGRPTCLASARGKAVKIVSPLLPWLPDTYNYRVILMQRDLDEVIASQNKMLTSRGALHDDSQNERVKQRYEAMCDGTLRVLRSRGCFATLVVNYVDAVAQPEQTATRINQFLGGQLDERRMAEARDSSLYRNRRTDIIS